MKHLLFATTLLSIQFSIAQQNVGIGTTTPIEKLHVNGNIKADTLKPNALKFASYPGVNKVLGSDLEGNASWQDLNKILLPFYRTQPTDGAPLFTIHNNNSAGGTAMNILANYSSSATAIRGESTTGRAGVFTSTSGRALETSGNIKLTGIEESNRAVLTSDASGYATWNNRMFFKATGLPSQKTIPSNVASTITDWVNFPVNVNGNILNGGGLFDNQNGKYFVLKDGLYRISIKLQVFASDATSSDHQYLRIYRNTSLLTRYHTRMLTGWSCLFLTTIVNLNSQDYILFSFLHTCGNSVQIGDEPSETEFTIEKLD